LAATDPARFVSDLASRALAAMQSGDTVAAKQGLFRQLFRQYFDVEACARSALGPYWTNATAQQRQEFVKLYEDYVVIGYSAHLGALGGESFKVVGSQPDKEIVIVASRIEIQRRCADQGQLAARLDQPWLQGDRHNCERHQHGQRSAFRPGLSHPAE